MNMIYTATLSLNIICTNYFHFRCIQFTNAQINKSTLLYAIQAEQSIEQIQ